MSTNDTKQRSSEPGLRYDNGKPAVDLLPPREILEIAQVATHGVAKYEEHNWARGMKWGRVFSSCLRHLFAFWGGERYDRESGLHHLAHAGWNVLALLYYDNNSIGTDNRLTTVKPEEKKG